MIRKRSDYVAGSKEYRAAYMREWRKSHPMTADQRIKDSARSYAGVYKRRGKLIPQPCAVCGDLSVEMHHPNYSEPLRVEWLCNNHHREHHTEYSFSNVPRR